MKVSAAVIFTCDTHGLQNSHQNHRYGTHQTISPIIFFVFVYIGWREEEEESANQNKINDNAKLLE